MEADLDALDGMPLDDLLIEEQIEDLLTCGVPTKSACWGSAISGALCTPSFVPGEGHFKNKFCPRCRCDGFDVAAERVCVLTTALRDGFANSNGRKIWTDDARLVNQTQKCTGPRLAIFNFGIPTGG